MVNDRLDRVKKANKILNNYVKAIQDIKINSDFSKSIDAIKKCEKNNGRLITVGMGKAGIIMRKFSSTMCSLGIPSYYIHPGEASHGDLGMIGKNDILFVASTSGKTREVLETISLSRNVGIKTIIGITSHIDSPIRKMADIVIDMGEIIEEGHLKIAPTTSTLVMLSITDCLALIIAEENNFTKEEYAKRHHSGYCGSMARGDNVLN